MSFLPPFNSESSGVVPVAKTFMTPTRMRFSPPISMLEHAEYYITQQGWALCLLRPHTKMPMMAAWNNSVRYIDTVEKAREILSANPGHGIGLIHEPAQTGTFDIDHLGYLRLICADLGIDLDSMLAGYPRIKSRAGRDKILFKIPVGFTGAARIKLCWPDETGECDERGQPQPVTVFEFRSGANQDVLPPSIHPDTEQPYEWVAGQAPWDYPQGIPEAPAEILALWHDWPSFQRELESLCPWGKAAQAAVVPPPVVRHVSDSHHGDLIGKYNAEIQCWEILERNGYRRKGTRWLCPSSSTKIPGVVYLKETGKVFSHHASDPINTGHAHDAFSLLTLLECGGDIKLAIKSAARILGSEWGVTALPDVTANISSFISAITTSEPDTKTSIPPISLRISQLDPVSSEHDYQFPKHLLQVPGLVGAVSEYINQSALFQQPILSLAASLSFCGALMGRKIRTETDLRTNIYTIAVAESGSGKEHARKAIKKLAQAADAEMHIGGEKIASDQGLFALLDQHPSPVVLMDEFGRTLRVMTNDRAPPHLVQLLTTIMELTGCADSYIMEKRRAEHGPKTPPRRVVQPNLCLYATTVPGRLYQGLTPDEVTDGFLPRWLVFESDLPDPEFQEQRITTISSALAESVNCWVQRPTVEIGPDGNLDFQVPVIAITPGASSLLSANRELWNKKKQAARGTGLDALWARAAEHAMRLALIRGAGDQGFIDEDTMRWGGDLTDHLLERMSEQALANLAKNDHENQVQKVQAFLQEKQHSTLSELTRKFRWLKVAERNGILDALVDAKLITVSKQGTGGRSRVDITWEDTE